MSARGQLPSFTDGCYEAVLLYRNRAAFRRGSRIAVEGAKVLGVHSAPMDMGGRDVRFDESLGLNCAW